MHFITGNYRNEACKALAERVNRHEAVESLDVKLRVHLHVNGCSQKLLPDVLKCLERNATFVLLSDQKNYTIFLPHHRAAICYKDGDVFSRDRSDTDEKFIERVKMGMVSYNSFYEPQKLLNGKEADTMLLMR